MFAETSDVAARLGRDLTDAETTMVAPLIASVTALIGDAGGLTTAELAALDDDQPVLKAVTVEAVVRVLQNPAGVESVSEQLGSYQHQQRWANPAATGLHLTTVERRLVRRALGTGVTGVTLETPHFTGSDVSALDFAEFQTP